MKTTESGKKMPNEQCKSPLSSRELKELHTKIMEIKDSNVLQGIVDIVEASELYEISSTTFDFDLCKLDGEMVVNIKQYLEEKSVALL